VDRVAELLASLAPGRLTKCYRATGGTESVDIALQVAMAATGRHKFVSLDESYHGHSVGAKSVVSSDYAREHGGLRSRQVAPPLDSRAADTVETILRKRNVAAFIMEPVVINLGVLVPDKASMSRIGELCRKYGTRRRDSGRLMAGIQSQRRPPSRTCGTSAATRTPS
jgi:4-aminobutyrate aminotransferase-like enzyme